MGPASFVWLQSFPPGHSWHQRRPGPWKEGLGVRPASFRTSNIWAGTQKMFNRTGNAAGQPRALCVQLSSSSERAEQERGSHRAKASGTEGCFRPLAWPTDCQSLEEGAPHLRDFKVLSLSVPVRYESALGTLTEKLPAPHGRGVAVPSSGQW